MTVIGAETTVPFTVGGGIGPQEESTFRLKPEYPSNISASFFYGHPRMLYLVAAHMVSRVIGPVADEHVKDGLRSLGIFEES